jgi:hypothetical protein
MLPHCHNTRAYFHQVTSNLHRRRKVGTRKTEGKRRKAKIDVYQRSMAAKIWSLIIPRIPYKKYTTMGHRES